MCVQFYLSTFFFISCSNFVISDRILVIWPLPQYSHFKSFQPLFEEIAKRGHELTIVSSFKLDANLAKNYTHVDLRHTLRFCKIAFAELRELNPFGILRFAVKKTHDYSEKIYQDPQVQHLLRSNQTFDLVMGELFFLDNFLSFGYYFNAPVIGLCPHSMIYHDWLLSNPSPVSYAPHVFLPMVEKMSFVERFINVGYNILVVLYMELIAFPKYQSQMEKYVPFGSKPVPNIRDVVSNVSVVLVNSHHSFNFVRPSLPNIISVAGLHLKPTQPLPEDLQKFMDRAKAGVIYVSFGSLIAPKHLPNLGETIVKLLAGRPERILLKWDQEFIQNIPPNFLIHAWTPQNDVLNHPNCRLFITHGGLHSVIESINASVPLVGIPFFTDQYRNMESVQYYGIGKHIHFENLKTDLLPAVEEILDDLSAKYFENVKRRSQLFNDRQSSPMETAMFWVDHILKHKENTSHLKPYLATMSWFTYLSLDIIIVMIILLVFLAYFMYCILWRFHLAVEILGSTFFRMMKSSYRPNDETEKKNS